MMSQLESGFDHWKGDPNLDLGDDDLHNCQDQLAPVGIVPAIFDDKKWMEN